MTGPQLTSLAVIVGWLCLAALIPCLRAPQRVPAIWTMVVPGVPALGWLTLHWGPGFGVTALLLGLWVLICQPLRPRRSRAGAMPSALRDGQGQS